MKTRKLLIILLSAAILLSLFSGCSTKKENRNQQEAILNTESEFPLVKEPITLKFMVGRHYSQSSYKDILTWSEYEKMTNVHIEWEEVPLENIEERRNLVLASNQDLPDGFFRCNWGQRDVQRYGSEGTFVKWNDYIDKYMPNFKNILNTMADVRRGIPNVDGAIYGLPALSDAIEIEINPKIYMNQKFMDKVGAKMPTTLDEMYKTLKLMKDKDANNNGKADEIPLTASSWSSALNAFKGAFGLMNKGSWHSNYDIDPKTNKLRFIPITPEFRQLLEYMNKLYSEGLLDNEIFTNTSAKVTAKVELNLVGGFIHTNTTVAGSKYVNDFTGITEALEGPNGDKLWTAVRGKVSSKGAFVMTKTNPYPEVTARWMDFWFSEEGSKLFYMGVEGESYQVNDKGEYEFIPEKVVVPEGSTYDQTVAKFTPYAGGANPVIALSKYFQGAEMHPVPKKCAADLSKYTPSEIWGYFNYTDEESDMITSLETDIIKNYYDKVVSEFIAGTRPLNDQTWDEYVNKYYEMGLDKLMSLYQTGHDRYYLW